MKRRIAVFLGAMVVCAGFLVAVAPPANACGEGSSAPCSTVVSSTANTGYFSVPGTSCGAYISSTTLGGSCAAPGSYNCAEPCPPPPTWREIINEHSEGSFDPCRVQRIADGFRPPPPKNDDPDKEWLIELCIVDYDLDSTDGGDFRLIIRRVWDEYEEEPWWMEYIWGDVAAGQSTFPFPVLNFGPQYPEPIVGTPTFFWATFNHLEPDGTTDEVTVPYKVPLGSDANTGKTVYLVARIANFKIKTGEPDPLTGNEHLLNCHGYFKYEFETGKDSVEDFPHNCAWTYQHSSAAQPDGVYKVTAQAKWRVYYKVGDCGEPCERFLSEAGPTIVTTYMEHEIAVKEIQVRDQVFRN